MRRDWRVIGAFGLGGLLLLAACADDGADRAYQAQRAADIASELRSNTTAPETTQPAATTPDETSTASSSTMPPTTTIAPTGVVVPVMAIDNTFRPELIEIKVGDEVLWENRGMNEHDILFVEGEGWGVEVSGFQPGAFFSHVFTVPGEYAYYCTIHGDASFGMTGTVIVTA